jgi:hypothetical protein
VFLKPPDPERMRESVVEMQFPMVPGEERWEKHPVSSAR